MVVDPGRTSGIFIYDTLAQISVCYEVKDYAIFAAFDRERPEILVTEKFVYQKRPHVDLFPVEIIGVLKYLSFVVANTTVQLYHEQMPDQAKIISDKLLKQLGFYRVNKPHANDAARHAVVFCQAKNAPGEIREWFMKALTAAKGA